MQPQPLEDLLSHAIPLGEAVALLNLLVASVIIPACFMLVRRLSAIRDSLQSLNSRTSKMEQWQVDHDHRVESEDHQHDITRQQCQALHFERMNSIHERINELWLKIGDRRQGRRPTD